MFRFRFLAFAKLMACCQIANWHSTVSASTSKKRHTIMLVVSRDKIDLGGRSRTPQKAEVIFLFRPNIRIYPSLEGGYGTTSNALRSAATFAACIPNPHARYLPSASALNPAHIALAPKSLNIHRQGLFPPSA
jgi:hypothetical protein